MNSRNLLTVSLALTFIFILNRSAATAVIHEEKLPGSQEVLIQTGPESWTRMAFRTMFINGKIRHFIVSSELDPVDPFEGTGKYGGHNLFDNDLSTAWVEGVAGQGKGEYVIFGTGEDFPGEIMIRNGYQKSERLFNMNSRPRSIKISLLGGFFLEGDETEIASLYRIKNIAGPENIILEDIMDEQVIKMPFDAKSSVNDRDSLLVVFSEDFRDEIEQRKKMCSSCDMTPRFSFFVKLEIDDVFKGSEWADNCLSELSYNPVKPPVENKTVNTGGLRNDEKILDVYEDEDTDAGIIYIDTDQRKKIVLADKTKLKEYRDLTDDVQLSITLMDVSPDKEWAQVDLLFYSKDAGRVEEYSALYNVRMIKKVDESVLKTIYGVFGFVEDNGKIWLDTADGYVDLEEIRKAINNQNKEND